MWKRWILGIGIALVLMIIGYQLSFICTRNRVKNQSSEQEMMTEEQYKETALTGNGSNKVTRNTRIVVESYDSNGTLLQREEEPANADMIGNNRLEMLVYANGYREKASEEEKKRGLERMVLESFSPELVTLVKYYGEPEEETGYYIGVKDNAVIVYTEDRSQVYEYTNIELWTLPHEIQYEIVEGIYVENEQELFDFLQTYSS